MAAEADFQAQEDAEEARRERIDSTSPPPRAPSLG